MAKYRHVHTSFWEDPFVESLTPEQKYFFLFLMTNPKVRQCGIYQITPKQIEYFSGYNRDVAGSLLNFFIERNKIEYDQQTNEIMIVNWAKFNLTKGGKPMIDCLISELKEVKSKSFISRMAETIEIIELAETFKSFAFEKSQSIDNKPLIVERHDTYHDTSTSSGQKEKEKEKEKENKKSIVRKSDEGYSFDSFWDDYDKKYKKEKCQEKWDRLKPEEKEQIRLGVKGYVARIVEEGKAKKTHPANQFQPHPMTFLNGKMWKDETFLQFVRQQNAMQVPLSEDAHPVFKMYTERIKKMEKEPYLYLMTEAEFNQILNLPCVHALETDTQKYNRILNAQLNFSYDKSQPAPAQILDYLKQKFSHLKVA